VHPELQTHVVGFESTMSAKYYPQMGEKYQISSPLVWMQAEFLGATMPDFSAGHLYQAD
jgi:hypothetical protein